MRIRMKVKRVFKIINMFLLKMFMVNSRCPTKGSAQSSKLLTDCLFLLSFFNPNPYSIFNFETYS